MKTLPQGCEVGRTNWGRILRDGDAWRVVDRDSGAVLIETRDLEATERVLRQHGRQIDLPICSPPDEPVRP